MSFYKDMILQEGMKDVAKKAVEVAKDYGRTAIGSKDPAYKAIRAPYDKEIAKYREAIKRCKERGDKEGVEQYQDRIKEANAEFQKKMKKYRDANNPKQEIAFI